MPIYEYRCDDCGKTCEILIKNRSKESEVVCPDCQSSQLTKLISSPGAVMTKGGIEPLPTMPSCPNSQGCGNSTCPAFQH